VDGRTSLNPPLHPDQRWRVFAGDTLALLPEIPDASVDAVVCDPPYAIGIENSTWDGTAIRDHARRHHGRRPPGESFALWTAAWAAELGRVLKPGGHLVAFGAPRTVHRLTCGLEDGGLEIRDMLMWMFGPGIPKSRRFPHGQATTLKPLYEPIVLARRPLDGTSTTANIDQYGTGTLNVDAASVLHDDEPDVRRWPPHVVATHAAGCRTWRCVSGCPVAAVERQRPTASRFMYVTKVTPRERDAGCEHLPARQLRHFTAAVNANKPPRHNPHPTVKPIDLMRWLVALITPTDGVVLDPFCGSGSTGIGAVLEGRRFVGLEREPEYVQIARARIAHWEATRHE
jgi:DNA modification methylase